jgi:hypothetical protein
VGGCRNGGQQLVARRLWCTNHQLGCLVWWLNPACSHERYTPKPLLSLHRKGQLAWYSLGYRLYFCVSEPSSGRQLHEAETGSRLTNGSCAISLNSNYVVLNAMPNVIVDVGLTTVDVYWLFLTDIRRFLTVLVDRRLLGSQCCLGTGLVANGICLTKRCNTLSSQSDVTRGLSDLGKSFTLLVCVCYLTSRLTTVKW